MMRGEMGEESKRPANSIAVSLGGLVVGWRLSQ